jgi:hypothetical protein
MAIWRYGDMAIWRYGDMAIWRYGDMAIWSVDAMWHDGAATVSKGWVYRTRMEEAEEAKEARGRIAGRRWVQIPKRYQAQKVAGANDCG